MQADNSYLTRTSTTLLAGLCDPRDQESWQEFDRRYRPLILSVARRLGLQPADAEDAAQETIAAFVEAYRQRRYERSRGRLRHWLCGIARHKVLDIRRQRQRRESCQSDPTAVAATAGASAVSDDKWRDLWSEECDRVLLRQALVEVRRQVPSEAFESFYLYVIEQWPAKRVAQHLHISVDSVYQHKSRMLGRIRNLLPTLENCW
ncbi:MAG: sigma-70 family RNA polymerase sigma factor [Sedimentisphaerales bacterium]|nr:sigma-70 family RNA polymerase sigma factor [Sedimentisphaerales bacterium]